MVDKKEVEFKRLSIKNKYHWYVYDIDGQIITHGRQTGSGYKSKADLSKAFKQHSASGGRPEFFTLRKDAIRVGKQTYQYYNTPEEARSRRIYKRTGWQYFVRIRYNGQESQAYSNGNKAGVPVNDSNVSRSRNEALRHALGQINSEFYSESNNDFIDTLERTNHIQILRERIIYFDRG